MRYLFNWLQAVQLILNVGIIIISNGEALSQVAKFRLCYAICCLVFAIAGFLLGQVRTLQKFGWLANAAVFINVAVMAVSMYGCYHAGPVRLSELESNLMYLLMMPEPFHYTLIIRSVNHDSVHVCSLLMRSRLWCERSIRDT